MMTINDQTALQLFQTMLFIRLFEEKIISYYPEQEMKTPVHLCIGQEAIPAGVCAHLQAPDTIFSTHRNHGHCLAKGMDVKKLLAEFYGKQTGCCGGRGGSMHPADPTCGILGTSAIVGGSIPLAVGAAWASSMQGTTDVSVAFFGDGASEEGTFHESLNFAALKKIPVIFLCENNSYATASHCSSRQPQNVSISDKAHGYGLPGFQIDGNDVLEVYRVAGEAVTRARKGQGPTLIEAATFRWMAHVGPVDDTKTGHRPAPELASWKKKCPVQQFQQLLLDKKLITNDQLEQLRHNIDLELEAAVSAAKQALPPTKEDLLNYVYTD